MEGFTAKIEDFEFVTTLYILDDVLEILNVSMKLLQEKNIMHSEVISSIELAVTEITERFTKENIERWHRKMQIHIFYCKYMIGEDRFLE